MKSVTISAGQPYEVQIGAGLLGNLGERLRELPGVRTAAVISDENTDKLFGGAAVGSLERAGFRTLRYAFPGGERNKNMKTVTGILEFLAENGVTRSDCLVALGGGIAGDITGFCAASYQRGIGFVQLPTTLLAAVDSSVGGKTGVNLKAGKNLAGAFWQPKLVLCDTDCLQTLPSEIFAGGMAEVIKYGVLEDAAFFDLLIGRKLDIEEIIARCVGIKAKYVAADERDAGERRKLNLGHTFGHAIERAGGYALSHGQAVAVGMVMAAKAADILGISQTSCGGMIADALSNYGLPVKTEIPAAALFPAMTRDKKRAGDDVTLVLPVRIGGCVLKRLSLGELEPLLEEVCKWK